MYIYDINDYVKSDSTLQTLAGTSSISIFPLVGYESDQSPIFLYQWEPGHLSVGLYFVKVANFGYTVLDDDADRGYQISERLIEILDKADTIQGTIASTEARALWIVWTRSSDLGPLEREGFYRRSIYFQVGYVPLT